VAITADGAVYTTDTYSASLYKVDTVAKVVTLYLRSGSLDDGNGITAQSNTFYVSTRKGIIRVNTLDKSIALTPLPTRPCEYPPPVPW
jgi:hypothetical protein